MPNGPQQKSLPCKWEAFLFFICNDQLLLSIFLTERALGGYNIGQ